MASARPALGGGTSAGLGPIIVCVLALAGCTGPNPLFMVGGQGGDGGDGGRVGAAGSTGGATGGGGIGVSGGTGATAGAAGTGGTGATAGSAGGAGSGGMPGTGATTGTAGSGVTGGSAGSTPIDAGSGPADMQNPGPDAMATMDVPPAGTGTPPAVCGTQASAVNAVVAARGIAIDASGTLYFPRTEGNRWYIGRVVAGQAAEPTYHQMRSGNMVGELGIMRVDSNRRLLYVSDPVNGQLYGFDVFDPPADRSGTGVPGAHGLALAADGAIFVSSSDGRVYRLIVDLGFQENKPTTAEPIFPAGQRPLGIAFGPSGHLYVGSSNGPIRRFRLENNMLVDGTNFGTFSGTANDLAFDVEGRLYVSHRGSSARSLTIISPTGVPSSGGPTGLLAGLAFGRGQLSCQDLYVSDAAGAAQRFSVPAPALNLP